MLIVVLEVEFFVPAGTLIGVKLLTVTELVTDLDSLVTDPVLALALKSRMYLSGGLVM